MSNPELVKALEQLAVHDHLCLIYETQEEQFAAAIPFLRLGLERGEQCLYITDENTASAVFEAMRAQAIDVDAAVRSGALAVVSKQEAYLKQGYFDPDWMIRFLKQATDSAKAAGFTALRATGEMTWALGGDPGVERLMEYEAKLNYFFPENDIVAICQYNRNRFSPQVILDVIRTHPLVIYGGLVCKNLYYVPPDEFLRPGQPGQEVQRLLSNILDRERAEAELKEAEARFRGIFENAAEGISLITPDGQSIAVNPALAQMLGYQSPKELMATVTDIGSQLYVDPERRAEFIRLLQEQNAVSGLETQAYRKDGSEIWVSLNSHAVRDASGTLLYMETMVQDITVRKRAEEAVKAERQRFNDVLETLPVYLVLLTPDYHVPFANRFFRERFGESHGRRCFEYLFNRTEPCEICETYTVLKTMAPHEWEWTGPDGRNYYIFDFPFTDTDGSTLIMETGIDITVQKRAEAALQARARQQAVVAELGQRALIGTDLQALMDDAVALVAQTLEVEYCKLLELLPDGNALLLRAGVGWKDGLVGHATMGAGTESQAGYTLLSDQPVIVEDLRTETRFSGPPLLHDHGVVSGMSVIIRGKDRPFGVLGAHTTQRRAFTQDDIRFLRAVANVLAQAIERKRVEEVLKESQERLLRAQHVAKMGFLDWDLKTNEVFLSDEIYRIFGLKREGVLTTPELVGLVVHPDDMERVQQYLAQAIQGVKQYGIDHRIVRPDGEIRWVHALAELAHDADGKPITLLGTIIDITERKQAEEKGAQLIREQAARAEAEAARARFAFLAEAGELLGSSLDYRTTLDSVARLAVPHLADWCSVALAEADGSIQTIAVAHKDPKKVEWARELQRRYPTDPNAPTGVPNVLRTGQSEIYPEIPEALLVASAVDADHLKMIREVGFTSSMVVPLVAREQTLGAITFVSAESGRRYGADDLALAEDLARRAGMAIDNAWLYETAQRELAERKRAEEALQERTIQLEAANKELESFSYSVSHDLRAPLRAIDGFSRILLEEHAPQLGSEAQRYLQLVRDNTQQMGNLVDDLLTFSRLSRQALKKQLIAPADLVRQALDDLRAEQEGRRVEITIGDLPACEADPVLLKSVFGNLLSNALKFTRKREVARIEIGSLEIGDWAAERFGISDLQSPIYYVRDNGVGFDMRYADRLFGVFQRLHRAEEYEGTGVGLAIVQRIVQRHGGRAWAEAEVDKGATFYFTLKGGAHD